MSKTMHKRMLIETTESVPNCYPYPHQGHQKRFRSIGLVTLYPAPFIDIQVYIYVCVGDYACTYIYTYTYMVIYTLLSLPNLICQP